MVTMFDRLDLEELYNLVMQRKKISTHKRNTWRMLSLKLIAESASESTYNLLRHQELASPEQTASRKDFSNLLMANS
ncbi:hypothetical protein Tco_0779849 [Tanacetum coccineum]